MNAWTFLICLHIGVTTAACTEHCPEAGFVAGERFALTVLEAERVTRSADEADCYFASGDVFALEAAPWDEDSPVCTGGAAGPPPFRADVLTECSQSRRGQLGMNCKAQSLPSVVKSCLESLEFYTYPELRPGEQVRNDMKMDFSWRDGDCSRCSGTLRIRVEREAPL
jgi:hypothetical protein